MLKENDRIVFLGDSITEQGALPNGYISIIRQRLAEKYPSVEIIGAGVSGNKIADLQGRVDKDVIAKNPTIVFIYIGINDVWHWILPGAKGTTPEDFESGLKEVIGKIQNAGAKVILCTPSVIGERSDGSNQLDKELDQYSDISRKVAKEMDCSLLDLRKDFIKELARINTDQKEEGILTVDGVHLNVIGNLFVAQRMLEMLGM